MLSGKPLLLVTLALASVALVTRWRSMAETRRGRFQSLADEEWAAAVGASRKYQAMKLADGPSAVTSKSHDSWVWKMHAPPVAPPPTAEAAKPSPATKWLSSIKSSVVDDDAVQDAAQGAKDSMDSVKGDDANAAALMSKSRLMSALNSDPEVDQVRRLQRSLSRKPDAAKRNAVVQQVIQGAKDDPGAADADATMASFKSYLKKHPKLQKRYQLMKYGAAAPPPGAGAGTAPHAPAAPAHQLMARPAPRVSEKLRPAHGAGVQHAAGAASIAGRTGLAEHGPPTPASVFNAQQRLASQPVSDLAQTVPLNSAATSGDNFFLKE